MKLTFTLICFILFNLNSYSQLTYDNLNVPYPNGGKVVFINDGRIFTGGFNHDPLYYKNLEDTDWETPGWSDNLNGLTAMTKHKGYIYALHRQSFYRSEDNGDTWENLTDKQPSFDGQSIVSVDDETLYATFLNAGVFKSTDDGMTWESLNDNYDDILLSEFNYTIINSEKGILTAGFDGVAISKDDGASFQTLLDETGVFYNDVEVLNGDIFVAGNAKGILKSSDDGITWDLVNPLTSAKSVYAVGNAIFAGGEEDFIYSLDQGETWESIYDDAFGKFVYGILHYEDNLYVSTFSEGLFKSSELIISSIKENELTPKTRFSIAPNPANDYIDIIADNTLTNNLSIEIVNGLGLSVHQQELTSLENIDISNLISGVYYVKIKDLDKNLQVMKLIKR